jgi:hypothetical protein
MTTFGRKLRAGSKRVWISNRRVVRLSVLSLAERSSEIA